MLQQDTMTAVTHIRQPHTCMMICSIYVKSVLFFFPVALISNFVAQCKNSILSIKLVHRLSGHFSLFLFSLPKFFIWPSQLIFQQLTDTVDPQILRPLS